MHNSYSMRFVENSGFCMRIKFLDVQSRDIIGMACFGPCSELHRGFYP
jgi:hypothetical protein